MTIKQESYLRHLNLKFRGIESNFESVWVYDHIAFLQHIGVQDYNNVKHINELSQKDVDFIISKYKEYFDKKDMVKSLDHKLKLDNIRFLLEQMTKVDKDGVRAIIDTWIEKHS